MSLFPTTNSAVQPTSAGGNPAFVAVIDPALVRKAKGEELDGDILVGVQPLSVFEAKLREAELR
jgi:hypothetical protein